MVHAPQIDLLGIEWLKNNDLEQKKSPTAIAIGLLGDPVGIRTPNLRIRSAMLYPVELQGPSFLTSRSIGGQR